MPSQKSSQNGSHMFTRIAVVNRGEPAVRLIRAVRELNEEFGYGIRVVALHTEAERRALFVRAADESVTLIDRGIAGSPYLDHVELERVLKLSGADAVWVGWGFVAEDPTFAELCEKLGITFIGPPAEAMRRLGDKIEAKLLAESSGVPIAPWSGGPVETYQDALKHAEVIKYPLILKARSGGGGRGIRIVREPEDLELSLERVQGEALRTFGDSVVFMEKLVQGGRHIEVQVMADNYGAVWAPGVRDCSIQRRNQKVIEESSSPALTLEQSSGLRQAAINLVRNAGYRGAGTVEFLYQPEEKSFAFLEVNTRLQVEHPITEATTGLDLVKLQIQVAAGDPLVGEPPTEFGHAIEARLNAEDADQGFTPAPGLVELLNLPSGPGIRVDTGIATGDTIPAAYDSMVAKVIAWGRDRSEALARLRRALRETTVVIQGGTTTKSFLLDLTYRPEVVSGSADTGWLDRPGVLEESKAPHPNVALLAVAAAVYDGEEAAERDAFLLSARGGRPRAAHAVGRPVELGHLGQTYRFMVAKVDPRHYRVEVGGATVEFAVDRLSEFESRLTLAGRRFQLVTMAGQAYYLVEVDGFSHRVVRDEGGTVRSPAPAVVVAVRAAAGAEVEAGETVVVLESMKMETAVRAPYAGKVREILVGVSSQVDGGAPLFRIDKIAEDDGPVATTPMIEFGLAEGPETGPRARAEADLAAMHALITGYDVSAVRARELITDYDSAMSQLAASDNDLLDVELGLLTTFADLCELSRNRPAGEEEESDERVHSPREYFHSYLRSLDVEREGLPESFRTRLSRVLGHYGLADIEPGAELEEAVFRVFLAQERAADQIPIVAALLERWLSADNEWAGPVREQVLEVLGRLVVATQLRYPIVGDLARSIRFAAFDQPLIDSAREQVDQAVRDQLNLLAQPQTPAEHAAGIEALVASSEPLKRLMAEQMDSGGSGLAPMLEALTRRFYKVRTLADARAFDLDGRPFFTGDFELSGQRLHLIATVSDYAELADDMAAVGNLASKTANPANVVTDLYISWADQPADHDEMSAVLRQTLDGIPGAADGRRVTVTVSEGALVDPQVFTFRPSPSGLQEERVIRGMHPLTGQRLDLWRLKNFNGTQMPAAEGVYLFHCVAPNNPADERLVALAEVRDVTPVRDASGEVTGFPAFERVLGACLDSIRRVQADRGARQRLDANQVFLHVWPPIKVSAKELADFARRTAPLTAGAGLEEVMILARLQQRADQPPRDLALTLTYTPGAGVSVTISEPPTEPLATLDGYTQKVQRSRARGNVYPYEIVPMLTGDEGSFTEYDFDADGQFGPVYRPAGQNTAGVVTGLVSTPTPGYPEGIVRVALFGDPTKALGTVAVAECALLEAAIDLADELGAPVEWFALSSGAKISMDSGTENMDGVARVLRRLINFTQDGGEVNVVVAGINVGAQPYWNAEATMLQHTKGILVMTPESAMVLTGKHSLDYSGGVSAEDNFGLGGYDRVMGPNGQAQYWAPDLRAACDILFAHYDHSYTAPGERFPRRSGTGDPYDRDICSFPHVHPSSDFTTVGDIFSPVTNKDRKKPFDIRTVIKSIVDQDHPVLERWAGMADADTAVVIDAHLGGFSVAMLGIESRAIPRRGSLPTDGPDQFTAGTLFPRSSKKAARAINAASGTRPLLVLANLSGFDGSPESLRNLQLEYGAEIGRAIVNFDGPIIFCVISRYHGGAFVVFSGALNDNMEVVAVEGSFASVIGGAPAAAVVFTRDVNTRTSADPEVKKLEAAVAESGTDDTDRAALRVQLTELRTTVRAGKLGEVAAEFEAIHNIDRALEVGSVNAIVPAAELRDYLIGAVERGMSRTTAEG